MVNWLMGSIMRSRKLYCYPSYILLETGLDFSQTKKPPPKKKNSAISILKAILLRVFLDLQWYIMHIWQIWGLGSMSYYL